MTIERFVVTIVTPWQTRTYEFAQAGTLTGAMAESLRRMVEMILKTFKIVSPLHGQVMFTIVTYHPNQKNRNDLIDGVVDGIQEEIIFSE